MYLSNFQFWREDIVIISIRSFLFSSTFVYNFYESNWLKLCIKLFRIAYILQTWKNIFVNMLRWLKVKPSTNSSGVISSHWENYISISFHIEWDMTVVTVILSILNQMEFNLVQNRKKNCNHDHIPFNLKINGNIVFSVQTAPKQAMRDVTSF